MSKYIDNVVFEEEFQGDKVRAVFRPLSFEDALTIEDIEVKPASEDPADRRAAQSRENIEVARTMAKFLPGYCVSFEGLVDASGKTLTIQEVCQVAFFSRLIVAMGRVLARAAYPENP